MTALIKSAIPLDPEAKAQAKNEYGREDISALEARKLYREGYIQSNKHFRCPNCEQALITCRSIDGKRSPNYIDQNQTNDMHIIVDALTIGQIGNNPLLKVIMKNLKHNK